MRTKEEKKNVFVSIWTSFFEGNSQERMIQNLYQNGITHWYYMTTDDKNSICHIHNQDNQKYYIDNRHIISKIVDCLYDEESAKNYIEYIRT